MEKIGAAILGLEESGYTKKLEEVRNWLIDYANNEISCPMRWKLYSNHFPNADFALCQNQSQIAEFFGGLDHSQIMDVIVKGRLDFGKFLIVQNIDKQDDDLICTWTVNDVSELPGWAEVLDALFENFDFGWVDESDFFKRFPNLKEEIYTVYESSHDMTFIMKESWNRLECVGFHFGKPDKKYEDYLLDNEPLTCYTA